MSARDASADASTVSDQAWRAPALALSELVGWYAGYRDAGVAPAIHRGLPSPGLTVIFTLDDKLTIAEHPDPAQPAGSFDTLVGFQDTVVYADGQTVNHAELSLPPGGGIMLGSARDAAGGAAQAPGSFAAYVLTDEPDVVFARAVAAGAVVLTGPSDTDYGSRGFSVADPEGNRWSFGSYRGAPRR